MLLHVLLCQHSPAARAAPGPGDHGHGAGHGRELEPVRLWVIAHWPRAALGPDPPRTGMRMPRRVDITIVVMTCWS